MLLSAIFLNLRFDIVIIVFFIVDFSTNIKIYVRSAGSVAKENLKNIYLIVLCYDVNKIFETNFSRVDPAHISCATTRTARSVCLNL